MPLSRARLLPRAVARFHDLRPGARIDVEEGPHSELIERLRDGRLDFLVGALRAPSPGPDVVQEPLFDDRLVIVAGRDHPLAGTAAPTVAQLSAFPWVVARPGAPLLSLWRALFEDAGLPAPDAPVTCGSVMMIRGLLAESRFLTLLSPHQIAGAADLVAIGPPIEKTRRPIGLTMRADWRPAPAQRAFLDLLRELTEADRLRGIE